MKLFKRNNQQIQIDIPKEKRSLVSSLLGSINFLTGNINSNYTDSKSLRISSVYRAVDLISSSIAILSLDNYLYKNDWKCKQYNNLHYLLNVAPNSYMSAFFLKKNSVQSMLLKGNSYIYITRNAQGEEIKLDLLNSDKVSVFYDEKNQEKYYKILGSNQIINSSDMIHNMNVSLDGLVGLSTIHFAAIALGIAEASDKHSLDFFSGGGNMAGILAPREGVNTASEGYKKSKTEIQNLLNSNYVDTEKGIQGKSNSIIALDAALQYTPITVSNKDSQLLESRLFSITTIAQYFNVPPAKLFDLSKSSYSSQEQSQLDFLSTCIQPILEKLENEFYIKLFSRSEYDNTELKFDVSNLLRLDSTSQASFYSQMFNMGAMSVNEIREKINANYPVMNGNKHFIQQNLQPLDNLTNDIKNPTN